MTGALLRTLSRCRSLLRGRFPFHGRSRSLGSRRQSAPFVAYLFQGLTLQVLRDSLVNEFYTLEFALQFEEQAYLFVSRAVVIIVFVVYFTLSCCCHCCYIVVSLLCVLLSSLCLFYVVFFKLIVLLLSLLFFLPYRPGVIIVFVWILNLIVLL